MKKILLILIILTSSVFTQYYYNQYANFDGINDYLAALQSSDIALDSNAFTIEGWLYTQDTSGSNKVILSTINSSFSQGFALLVQGASSSPGNAGKLQLNLNGGNNNFTQTAGTRLALNGWSHFAVSFRNVPNLNDTIRFYINGTLIQTFTSNTPPPSNSSDSLRVGNCYIPNNYSNGFKGRIDDLRFYKREKTASIISNDRGIPLGMELFQNVSLLNGSNYYTGLHSSWNFDGNGNDRVGNYDNFSTAGGAFYSGNGFNPDNYRQQGNYYMRFPGGSWLSSADGVNSIFDTDTACTLEAWVYIDAYRTSPQTIISKGTSGYSYILAIGSSPSNSPLFILNSGSKLIQSSKPILPKVWTHIAATYRASTGEMQIFINGNLDTNRIFSSGNITTSNDSFYVGRNLFGETLYGNIDAIKISKYVKSQQEIQSLLYTSVDNLNYSGGALLQCSYNFEGNTVDNISNGNILIPRINSYFERLNSNNSASGPGQAPLVRTSNNDAGFSSNSYLLNSSIMYVGNGATIRDSILVNSVSGNNRVSVVLLMNHTYVSNVTLNLRAPNGTSVNFLSGVGGSNNDIITVFDDFADSLAGTNTTPFSMRVRPTSSLSALPQTNQNGYWRLSVTDNSANADSGRVFMWGLKFSSTVGSVGNSNNSPLKYSLLQNYPNPFNPVTTISFEIPKDEFVELKIYDINGREISTIISSKMESGTYTFNWDAAKVSSGIYFYKLTAGDFSETKKMILVK